MEAESRSLPRPTDGVREVYERGLRGGIPYAVAVFLVVRVFLSVLGVVAVRDEAPGHSVTRVISPGTEQPATAGIHNAVDGTNRWDAAWLTRIADDGYREGDGSAAFFPGYPLAVRLVDTVLPVGTLGAALLVSNLAFLAALVVLYALTASEFSEDTARKTVLLLAVFPSSFFFLAPYSESLFLLATLLAFWGARRDQWLLAGLAGLVAAATRNIGIAVVPALVLEAWMRPDRDQRLPRISCALIPLLAPIAYAGYWWARAGDPLLPFHAQATWTRSFLFPVATVGQGLALAVKGFGSARGVLYWTAEFVVAGTLITAFALGWRLLRLPYLVYAGIGLLIPLSYPLVTRPFASIPRYVVVLFPLFWPIAKALRDPLKLRLTVATFAIGYTVLAIAFMNWALVF
jgi:Mannosyltransferase (PIG-V)